MAEKRGDIVRVFARISALVSFLGGAAIIGVIALLIAAFNYRGFVQEITDLLDDLARGGAISLIVLSGVGAMALAPFVWRGQLWAMLAAAGFAAGFLFFFGNETLALKLTLSGVTALFVVCAALRLSLGRSAPR